MKMEGRIGTYGWIKPKQPLCLSVHVKEYAALYARMCQNQCTIQDLSCGLRANLNHLIWNLCGILF